MAKFGQPMKAQFLLSDKYTFINHGAFGTVARPVDEARQRKKEEFDSAPDIWHERTYFNYYKENADAAANFLGSKPENLVLVGNSTTGLNAVLRSVRFKAGDEILANSWTYNAVKNTLQWLSERIGVVIVMIDIRVPIKDKKDVIQAYKDTIAKHSNIKLAVIDVISSVPPVRFPATELSALCKESGIQVLLDGAHTPGQIDVQLEKWAPDYYVGNLHKWAYTNRGCAVLYIHPDHHADTDPTVISTFLHDDDIRRRFYLQGTEDGTRFCAVKDAIKFYQDVGGLEAIGAYNSNLVTKAAEMLTKRWGTRTLAIPRDMEAPNMREVRLPYLKAYPVVQEVAGDIKTRYGVMMDLVFTLMDRFHIITVCHFLQGEPYVRISANIYNSMEDYDKLADAIIQLGKE